MKPEKTTTEDYELIAKIVKREKSRFTFLDERSLSMDIESAFRQGLVDLERLLNADAVNFAHDLHLIDAHIERGDFPATFPDWFALRMAPTA